ncbi:MAG TPA: M3 family oligoendopeptidase [Candidatus Dormibacteraeota bacterium]|nr:M3 family oligoendopeptidase [Candidatus Dormibacteraeota bacterium]
MAANEPDPESTSGGKPLLKAQGIRWDLSPIHKDAADARAELVRQVVDARAFQSRYQRRVATLNEVQLAALLQDLGALRDRSRATAAYCELRTAADSQLPENQDLQAAADEAGVQIANLTRFFELEWQALAGPEARALTQSQELHHDRHFLERLTDQAAHTLTALEEQALAERSTAAVSAWQQLFGQTTSAITAEFAPEGGQGTTHTIDELRAYLDDNRPEVRKRALDTLYSALQPWTPVLARVYDTLVGDRLVVDRLRHFVSEGVDPKPLPMQQANLANDLSDQTVDTLIEAVESHHPLARRYFRIKAEQLGLKKLLLSDLYAPLGKSRAYSFDEGRQLVLDAMRSFSPAAEQILATFFTEHRIDAEPRPGKQSGAFCESVARDKPTYVLLSYTDTAQATQTLAHELGHGLHAVLAKREQTPLGYETGLAMAEVASTFNELLLFDHLLTGEQDPAARRRLIGSRVDRSFLTIFNQTMMARYEQLAYAAKGQGESLNPERLAGFWVAQGRKYFGDTVEVPEGYRFGWSDIPHFIYARFYTYSYAFAHLVSLALYARYLVDRSGFVPQYFELLGAGGSQTPAALLSAIGIEISDPRWVEPAFALISSWIDLAEQSGKVIEGSS